MVESVDYDFVIIGATYAGLELAKQAIALQQPGEVSEG